MAVKIKLFFAIAPELFILGITLFCRAEYKEWMIPVIVIAIILKLCYFSYNGFDEECSARRYIIIPSALFVLELGALTLLYTEVATTGLMLTAVLTLLTVILFSLPWIIRDSLRKNTSQEVQEWILELNEKLNKIKLFTVQRPAMVWIMLFAFSIAGLLFYWKFANEDDGNGTKNWFYMFGFSVQLSELLKLGVVAVFTYTTVRFRHKSKTVWLFYIYMGILIAGLSILIGEIGTAMQLGFFTLFSSFLLVPRCKDEKKSFIIGKAIPFASVCFLSIALGIAKRLLRRYCIANNVGEGNRPWGYYNCRLNSITEETFLARKSIEDAPFIRRNLIEYIPIISYSDPETIAADYCYATMCSCYGWLIPLAAVTVFILALGFVFFHLKKRILTSASAAAGIAAAGILFFQTLIHVLGVMRCCPFTGITLPFASPGNSSLIVSIILVCIIVYAISDDRKEVDHYALKD